MRTLTFVFLNGEGAVTDRRENIQVENMKAAHDYAHTSFEEDETLMEANAYENNVFVAKFCVQ